MIRFTLQYQLRVKDGMADKSLRLTHRIATWLIRWHSLLLVVSLGLTVAGVWPSSHL